MPEVTREKRTLEEVVLRLSVDEARALASVLWVAGGEGITATYRALEKVVPEWRDYFMVPSGGVHAVRGSGAQRPGG